MELRAARFFGPVSFAPSGLVRCRIATHGLRRGLHSCAASRLPHFVSQLPYFVSRLPILSREILAVRVESDVHTDVGFRIRGSVFPFLDGFHGTVGENGIATHY